MINTTKEELRIFKPEEIGVTKWNIKGEEYINIMKKVEKIILHQKEYCITNGIKGFIFHGDVGVGKTTLAKAIAHDLGSILIFVDGSDIARPLYGESESQIANVFRVATKFRHSIILIDDCESVFPARDWFKVESWHIAQNNVFFHELDNMDTSKTIVILTTNRYDLLDKAIKDRLLSIEFPKPSIETLIEIAKEKMKKLGMKNTKFIEEEIRGGKFYSIRSLEKYIIERYVEEIIRKV